ncbi:MAG TPA: DinB family protein [Rhodanobacteraceae bacterium]|nr:DinB family protein [Rhodanobacteraceae bacterium]
MKNKFRYKAWANAEILDSMAKIDLSRHPEQGTLALRLMNHTYVVDRIFAAHLDGTAHEFQSTNTPDTPSLDQLRERIAASDDWYQQYVYRVRDDELRERICFTFTDGDRGCMSREEMLFHVLTHGAYHRGNVGMILTSCGIDRPSDTFTRFLHLGEPDRRDAT